MNAGIAYAVLADVLWGVFPVYFKALQHVAAPEILAHRMVWSLAFVAAVLALRRRRDRLRHVLAAAGRVTALPLLAFAAGARGIPLSMAGLLQYVVAPALQLLLNVWLYREPVRTGRGARLQRDLDRAGDLYRRWPVAEMEAPAAGDTGAPGRLTRNTVTQWTASSSTSNSSVAFGGITSPAPQAP